MNMKLACTVVALLLSTGAHAAYQINAISALPSMPLNAPSVIPAHHPLALPSIERGPSLNLPSAVNLPRIAPSLPTLPMPVIGKPSIGLPSPVSPLPVAPTAVVRAPKIAAIATVRFDAPKTQNTREEAAQREKLERLFDRGEIEEQQPQLGETRHTLPENDLLNEIGVNSY